jgi:HEAT repeat protein
VQSLLVAGFAVTLALWIAASARVVISRLLYNRRARRLIVIERSRADPAVASLPPLDRSPVIREVLSRLSRRALYTMIASSDHPRWLTDLCADYAVEHWGHAQMVDDATDHRRSRRWRRIAALFALGHIGADEAYELLRTSVCDDNPELSSAAAVVLHRLGDRRAAEIMVSALRQGSIPASRVATHLDQFPIAIDDLLLPLLDDAGARARYWAASLLGRYPDLASLASRLAPLRDDAEEGVRKAVYETLGMLRGPDVIALAQRGLDDPVGFVRATAIRSLARLVTPWTEVARCHEIAAGIAVFMADREWEVRLAAKESLVRLGPGAWREVSALLQSPDAFARNGAAEVLQNLGVLDWSLRGMETGLAPSAELQDMLVRAFLEGGRPMIDAAIARSDPDAVPGAALQATSVRFVGAAS